MIIKSIKEAKSILVSEKIIALPTETVYGLAGLINSEKAVRSIFQAKERPFFDPLIVHVANLEQALNLSPKWDEISTHLAKTFWPGPLSIILPKSLRVSNLITAGLSSVAIRCPNHPLTLELLSILPCPIAAPSANKFTKTSPTTSQHVIKSFGNLVPVLEGGSSQVGLESTIIQILPEERTLYILRPGMISQEDLRIEIPQDFAIKTQTKNQTPGSMKSHYKPDSLFYLIPPGKNIHDIPAMQEKEITPLQLDENPIFAARELYSLLHSLPKNKVSFFQMEEKHLSEAWVPLMNRLSRASEI